MFKGKVLLFSLLLVLFATSLYAGDVDDCESEVYLSNPGLRVSICPAGDFEFIYQGGGGTSDYIRVIARDASGAGIPGIPWTDYWLNACDPGQELCLCAGAVVADSLTNEHGETTISGRIAGGGCILSGGVYVAIQGRVILEQPDCIDPICLDMQIVSPDITADCAVNLSDFTQFGSTYGKVAGDTGYNGCADYNDDDVVNLSDLAAFGGHYTHECF